MIVQAHFFDEATVMKVGTIVRIKDWPCFLLLKTPAAARHVAFGELPTANAAESFSRRAPGLSPLFLLEILS